MEIALRLGECCLSCHLMRFKAEKEALKWLSKAVFERAWQCVRPVNCLASRNKNSIWNRAL